MSGRKKTLTQEITNLAGHFLFGTPDDDNEALDMRTRIVSENQMKVLTYLGTIGYAFKSKFALQSKNMLERFFISHNGQGRIEGVSTLNQNFPSRVEVDVGTDDIEE